MTADSGTATTDSGASVSTVDGLGDVFKRQSASSLSDLEHLGKYCGQSGTGNPVRVLGKVVYAIVNSYSFQDLHGFESCAKPIACVLFVILILLNLMKGFVMCCTLLAMFLR